MNWPNKNDQVIKYDLDLIEKFKFNNSTNEFLVNTGLPKECAPFLSFVDNSNKIYEGILPLNVYYNFLNNEFSKYIIIGSNGCGDPLVIDSSDNCKIKVLNHDNNFCDMFVNTSILQLFNSLILYYNFIVQTLEEYGEHGILDNLYTIDKVFKLKEGLLLNDLESITDNSFWGQEIETLLIEKGN